MQADQSPIAESYRVISYLLQISATLSRSDARTLYRSAAIINDRHTCNHPGIAPNSAARRGRPSTHDVLRVAYVCLNPDMLSGAELARAAGISAAAAAQLRARVRKKAHGLATDLPAPLRSHTLPIDPATGLFYHETNTTLQIDHGRSLFYLFHATAWARYLYGSALIEHIGAEMPSPFRPDAGSRLCSIDYRAGVDHTLQDGRETYGGDAWLRLGIAYGWARYGSRNISLPVPIRGMAEVTTPRRLMEFLQAEGADIPLPRRGRPSKRAPDPSPKPEAMDDMEVGVPLQVPDPAPALAAAPTFAPASDDEFEATLRELLNT